MCIYADAVVEAIGDRTGMVLVTQSLGGITAPVDLLAMLSAIAR
jgi:hypothetical protein